MSQRPIAILAEDEAPQRQELRALLQSLWPELEVAAECADGHAAMAALARARVGLPARPLVDRLLRSKHEHETVALIHTLGRMGAAEAVPVLLGMARNTADPDVLRAIMRAMLGLPLAGNTASEAAAFAQSLLTRCTTNPTAFRVAIDRFHTRRTER